jgi:hypothetical protein
VEQEQQLQSMPLQQHMLVVAVVPIEMVEQLLTLLVEQVVVVEVDLVQDQPQKVSQKV